MDGSKEIVSSHSGERNLLQLQTSVLCPGDVWTKPQIYRLTLFFVGSSLIVVHPHLFPRVCPNARKTCPDSDLYFILIIRTLLLIFLSSTRPARTFPNVIFSANDDDDDLLSLPLHCLDFYCNFYQ